MLNFTVFGGLNALQNVLWSACFHVSSYKPPPSVYNRKADVCKGFAAGPSVLCPFVQITAMWNMGYNYESDARGGFTDLSTLTHYPKYMVYYPHFLFLCKAVLRM